MKKLFFSALILCLLPVASFAVKAERGLERVEQ
jgi:hypothetical protein